MLARRSRVRTAEAGFTLLELVVVIGIVGALAVLLMAAFGTMRSRAERVHCTVNLRNLSVAAHLYLQQNGVWPQIPITKNGSSEEYADSWISALAPFNATRDTWICPTVQRQLNRPDYSKPENARIDYMATPFDESPTSPTEWPLQPWFIETGDMHGNGNLIIFTDGSIKDLKTVVAEQPSK